MQVHDQQMVTVNGATHILPHGMKVDPKWSLWSAEGCSKHKLQSGLLTVGGVSAAIYEKLHQAKSWWIHQVQESTKR